MNDLIKQSMQLKTDKQRIAWFLALDDQEKLEFITGMTAIMKLLAPAIASFIVTLQETTLVFMTVMQAVQNAHERHKDSEEWCKEHEVLLRT